MASSLSRYLTQSSSGLSTVRLSRAGFDAIEIDVDNLSVSTVSRAFSVSHFDYIIMHLKLLVAQGYARSSSYLYVPYV